MKFGKIEIKLKKKIRKMITNFEKKENRLIEEQSAIKKIDNILC